MTRRWITIFATSLLALAGSAAFAQAHGRGHHKDKGDGDSARSDDGDRNVMRQWYDEREHSGSRQGRRTSARTAGAWHSSSWIAKKD